MQEAGTLLDELYTGQERISRSELHRRAVAAGAPAQVSDALHRLPDGEYAREELAELLAPATNPASDPLTGVPANQLDDADLLRELASVHRTRHGTLRHGSGQALTHHDDRQAELEYEYLRRFPDREVDPERLTAGARARTDPGSRPRTGAEQPWDPEDLVIAQGQDPTPENIERARRRLATEGAAAVERTVP